MFAPVRRPSVITSMVPEFCSTRPRAIVSPIPRPPSFVVNIGSNTAAARSFRIPGPLSENTISQWLPNARALMVTRGSAVLTSQSAELLASS